jgi:hypothetical protein
MRLACHQVTALGEELCAAGAAAPAVGVNLCCVFDRKADHDAARVAGRGKPCGTAAYGDLAGGDDYVPGLNAVNVGGTQERSIPPPGLQPPVKQQRRAVREREVVLVP